MVVMTAWKPAWIAAWMAALPLIGMLCTVLAAVPPLSDAERRQLDSASDGSPRLDEGALYPLVRNALEWKQGESVRAHVNPDYARFHDEPAAHRGELYLLEGKFAGRAVRFGLQRSGPWGDALTEWVLIVNEDPERVAVVFLVDPEGELKANPPRPGQSVRVPARFYKVWQAPDLKGRKTSFLTFVGRWPEKQGGGDAFTPSMGIPEMVGLTLLLAAALAFILWRSRGISLRARPLPRQSARAEARQRGEDAEATDTFETDDEPLPTDPADALGELSRRRGSTAHESEQTGTSDDPADAGESSRRGTPPEA